jgi:hypothetical protein
MPINKPWMECARLDPKALPGTVGVYELGDAGGAVIYIGYAGGRSITGLRGVVVSHRGSEETNPIIRSRLTSVRYEVTTSYLTRHLELLSRYREAHGALPEGNIASGEPLPPLARFHRK